MQMCQIYRSDLGILGGEVADRTNTIAAATQQLTLASEEARLHSQNYFQTRGELAESYSEAVGAKSEYLCLHQIWCGEEHGLIEQIESTRDQARSYEEQFKAEVRRYTKEVASESAAAQARLQQVEEQANRDLAQANAL